MPLHTPSPLFRRQTERACHWQGQSGHCYQIVQPKISQQGAFPDQTFPTWWFPRTISKVDSIHVIIFISLDMINVAIYCVQLWECSIWHKAKTKAWKFCYLRVYPWERSSATFPILLITLGGPQSFWKGVALVRSSVRPPGCLADTWAQRAGGPAHEDRPLSGNQVSLAAELTSLQSSDWQHCSLSYCGEMGPLKAELILPIWTLPCESIYTVYPGCPLCEGGTHGSIST